MMMTAQIDYRNLQFLLYQDDKPVENPLPAEVQRVVILHIIHDVITEIRAQINGDVPDRPPGLKEQTIH